MDGDANTNFPVFEHFKGSLTTFLKNVQKTITGSKSKPPHWFHDFAGHLEKFSEDFCTTVKAVEKRLVALDDKVQVLYKVSEALSSDRERLQKDVDDLQQYTRRTNLLIHGVPEKPGENTDNVVCNVLKKMNVNMPLDDIGRSHRLGKKIDGKKRPVKKIGF